MNQQPLIGYHTMDSAIDAVFHAQKLFDGNAVNRPYFATLFGLTTGLEPKTIVEIGAQYGVSTRAFLAATATSDRTFEMKENVMEWRAKSAACVVHSIDIDPSCGEGPTKEDITALGWADRWKFHAGKSQDLEPIECDLLYVDGDHSYEAVCSDMARWGTKVRDNGLVILDDYHFSWPGKVRWVNERWDKIHPLIIGPTAVVRVTREARQWFAKEY